MILLWSDKAFVKRSPLAVARGVTVLRPEIAALSMSGSSFIVAVNALMLKRLQLPAAPPQGATVAPDSTAHDTVDPAADTSPHT